MTKFARKVTARLKTLREKGVEKGREGGDMEKVGERGERGTEEERGRDRQGERGGRHGERERRQRGREGGIERGR